MLDRNLDLSETPLPEWYEPFPEPHTMPSGWNLDNIVPSLTPAVSDKVSYLLETHPAEERAR